MKEYATTRHKLAIIVSIIGLILALILMVAVNVNRVQTVYGSEQYYKGMITEVGEDFMVIKFDQPLVEMDENPPEIYTPVELRVIDLGYPDPVVTPTAVGDCEDPCDD